LETLAGDPYPAARQAVAGNRSAPPATLSMLMGDRDPRVREKAVLNPSTPEEDRTLKGVTE
jgi:hypothetical protein